MEQKRYIFTSLLLVQQPTKDSLIFRVTKALHQFILLSEILLHFFAHVEDGTIATNTTKKF